MNSEPRTTAKIWDHRYSEPVFAFGTEPNGFLASQQARLAPGQKALVPGDGEGRNGVWLAGLGLDVVTVDASQVGVEKARKLATERGVRIDARAADLNVWPWPQAQFDVVAAIYIHFPPAERPAMHRRMLAALKPGGIVILECYSPRQLERRKEGSTGGPPPEMLVVPTDLASDFAEAEVELLQEVETVLAEGVRHVGPSTVVRLIARRR